MVSVHPLDHVTWSSLTGRQAHLAIVQGGARRYDPAYGVFGAVADNSTASLAALGALVAAHGDVALSDPGTPTQAPGTTVVSQDRLVQMMAERLTPGPAPRFEIVPLSDADGPEMLALATLTRARTVLRAHPPTGGLLRREGGRAAGGDGGRADEA